MIIHKNAHFKSASENKVLKEIIINNNHEKYGNVLWPRAIVSTYHEDIICTDPLCHRLLVFNRDFIFKYQIGSKGSLNGQFNEPVDSILNEIGKLYVADKNNFRVQIFSEIRKPKEILRSTMSNNSAKFSNLKSKSDIEFCFVKQIKFNDKPIKLTSSPLSSVVAVATENGFIFILNEVNQIINFLRVENRSCLLEMQNICLNENGSELICMKQKENNFYLKFYKINNDDLNETANKVYNDNMVKKLEMIRKVKLEKITIQAFV